MAIRGTMLLSERLSSNNVGLFECGRLFINIWFSYNVSLKFLISKDTHLGGGYSAPHNTFQARLLVISLY